MGYLPAIVVVAILLIAVILYYMLPAVIDQEKSFLWIAAGFILVYIGAAYYLSRSLPAIGSTADTSVVQNGSTAAVSIPDVVSRD